MAERSYVSVDRAESPRIIEVAAVGSGGSNEITIQDLHDTLNSNTLPAGDPDDSLDNMDDEYLIDSAGKEELGGGVQVGITSTLRNAQVAFQGNYTPAQLGTATATGLQTLTDGTAQFITNGVNRGAIIINFTDRSVAEVLEVLSETVLRHRALQAGTGNDWDLGDSYAIFNIIQKNISGGNLVANDDLGSAISPVFPTFATQIVRTASSSATLQELEEVRHAAFEGVVTLDVVNGSAGTTYPAGTPSNPVDNISDARTIMLNRGIKDLQVVGNLILNAGDWSNTRIHGDNPTKSTITVTAGAVTNGTEFDDCTVSGVISGTDVQATNAILFDVSIGNGFFDRCGIQNMVTLTGGIGTKARFIDCYGAGNPITEPPTLDLGGSGPLTTFLRYSGLLILQNKTDSQVFGATMMGGAFQTLPTVTGSGQLIIAGQTGRLEHNGTSPLVDLTIKTDQSIVDTMSAQNYDSTPFSEIMGDVLAMVSGKIVEGPAGTFTFYERDDTTPRFVLQKVASERVRV